MKVYNVTQEQIRQAALLTPCKLQDLMTDRGPFLQFVIRPTDDTPILLRKVSDGGRKVYALNWYGHKCFYDQLFALAPKAKVKTNWEQGPITYDGIESYKAQVR